MIRLKTAILIFLFVCLSVINIMTYGQTNPENEIWGGHPVNPFEIKPLEEPDLFKPKVPNSTVTEDTVTSNKGDRYTHLTDADFQIVADELGIEPAVIKAVVAVEAGPQMKGFFAPGIPVINFDPSMFAIYKNKAHNKVGNKSATVPAGLTGYALKEWTQLTNARKINAQGADMGTFWGMFQIGGFNYKICGCESVEEYVRKISDSEFEQLEIFAVFIKNTGMLEYLKKKDWAGFSRRYNGSGYAKRGYHTKMANAYKKFKNAAN